MLSSSLFAYELSSLTFTMLLCSFSTSDSYLVCFVLIASFFVICNVLHYCVLKIIEYSNYVQVRFGKEVNYHTTVSFVDSTAFFVSYLYFFVVFFDLNFFRVNSSLCLEDLANSRLSRVFFCFN